MPDEQEKHFFLKDLALFFLKLQTKFLIPADTVQNIVSELDYVSKIEQSHLQIKLSELLADSGLKDNKIKDIVKDVMSNSMFHNFTSGPLRTEQTRKTFYKQNLLHLEPVQLFLGKDKKDKPKYAQYVSILESIKALFDKYPSHVNLVNSKCTDNDIPHVFNDIKDGLIFKSNPIFKDDSVQIILYQDAFEVVNPLGSARKKHKVLGVYYTLANIEPHLRSSIDHIQLVLLCTESDLKFGQDKVFGKLVEDLRFLEQTGLKLKVKGEQLVKGSLCAIVGDNLGSHGIGGFSEGFNHKYFCRFCLLDLDSFHKCPYQTGKARTIASHKQELQFLEQNPHIKIHNGVKFDSVFNSLEFFHVSMPGLPPCLGHDLFEGIVSYDLPLIINHLVKNLKWFTYADLNRKITWLKYSGTDSLDRPCEVNENADRLPGHAVQNWVFLRLFSILVGEFIQDPMDTVWQLYISLKKIVELVCSPSIHQSQIVYLQSVIENYLDLRSTEFPDVKLRPKHHYLLHYPKLILSYGPLIRLWTMRFESKHSYFKKCARTLQNFKHITFSLAERHQLLQAFYSAGSLFKPTLQVNCSSEFNIKLLKESVVKAIFDTEINFTKQNTVLSDSLVFKGTEYKINQAVVLDKSDDQITMGLVMKLLVKDGVDIYVIVNKCSFSYISTYGYFVCPGNPEDNDSFTCLRLSSLLCYSPLSLYRQGSEHVLSLKYSLLAENLQ